MSLGTAGTANNSQCPGQSSDDKDAGADNTQKSTINLLGTSNLSTTKPSTFFIPSAPGSTEPSSGIALGNTQPIPTNASSLNSLNRPAKDSSAGLFGVPSADNTTQSTASRLNLFGGGISPFQTGSIGSGFSPQTSTSAPGSGFNALTATQKPEGITTFDSKDPGLSGRTSSLSAQKNDADSTRPKSIFGEGILSLHTTHSTGGGSTVPQPSTAAEGLTSTTLGISGPSALSQAPSTLKFTSTLTQKPDDSSVTQAVMPSGPKVTFGATSEIGNSKPLRPDNVQSSIPITSAEQWSSQPLSTSALGTGKTDSFINPSPGIVSTKFESPSIMTKQSSLKAVSEPSKPMDKAFNDSLTSRITSSSDKPSIVPSDAVGPSNSGTSAPKADDYMCNSLKGKTMEEIVARWSGQMDEYMKTFHRQATQVMNWDTTIFENSYIISKLCGKLKEVEELQKEIDDNLNYIDTQQTCMEEILETQQLEIVNAISNTDNSIRNRYFSDEERGRYLSLAEEIDSSLSDIYLQLTNLTEQFSTMQIGKAGAIKHLDSADISRCSDANSSTWYDDIGNVKNAIVAILSNQLHTLDWLNTMSLDIKQKIDVLSSEAQKSALKMRRPAKD